jgi:secreted trypsin-like serine protease
MAKLICVAITIFALCATNFATGESVEQFIVGGTPAIVGAFPSVVSITSSNGQQNCLGNVINDWHVLTAASCVLENNALINPFRLIITGGDLSLNIATYRRVQRNVTTIYPHSQFNQNTNVNNLAVLRVGARFPFPHNTVEAATLATQPITTPVGCRFAGWSTVGGGVGAVINPVQQVINVPLLPAAQCQNPLPVGMFCGGVATQTPCAHAIGGGLYCGNDNLLTGILVFNTACGLPFQPGVYIEVRRHLVWINQQFTRTVRFRPGTLVHQTG